MPSPHIPICILLLALGAASNPLPEPTPPPLATPCTTYLTRTISGFRGNFTPEVVHTVYTTTATIFSYVPCNGCTLSVTGILAPDYGGVGPQEVITARTTATRPYNVTSTVCLPTDNLGQLTGHEFPKRNGRVPKKPPPTNPVPKSDCPAYTTKTSSTAHVISIPAMRTNPIEPTTTRALKQEHERRLQVPALAARQQQQHPVTTITRTSQSWSTTTTFTKYTTCRLGPVQDPNPGAIPKKRDVDKRRTTTRGSECGTPPPSPDNTGTPRMRSAYTTVTIPVTGTLTRTTVRCTKTMLTRPWPRPTRDVLGQIN